MTVERPFPGAACRPCTREAHGGCEGWQDGFCGCTKGLCWLRLLTGVMWDIQDGPNGKGDGYG